MGIQSGYSQSSGNFYYKDGEKTFYVLTKKNASTLDLWARKGIQADGLLNNYNSTVLLLETRNNFLTQRIFEINAISQKSLIVLEKIGKDYDLLNFRYKEEEERAKKFKAQRNKAYWNIAATWVGITAATVLLVISGK